MYEDVSDTVAFFFLCFYMWRAELFLVFHPVGSF